MAICTSEIWEEKLITLERVLGYPFIFEEKINAARVNFIANTYLFFDPSKVAFPLMTCPQVRYWKRYEAHWLNFLMIYP